jgi:hypothetical protein
VGVRLERGEGDGGDNGEEDFSAEPDDEGEIEKSAKKSLHWERIQGWGGGYSRDFLGGKG